MEYSFNSKNFFVTELFKPALGDNGEWNYYVVEKKDLSHKQLLKRLPKDSLFCGVKDRNASTKQFMCTRQGIDNITEENLSVTFVGKSEKKLFIGAHKGNAFKVLTELNEEEAKKLKQFKEKNELVANYFGEQRFSANSQTILSLIEKEDYENALKLFLTQKTKFDTDKSRVMKRVIESNWGNWKNVLEHEEIKNTGKVVLFEFLEKNPTQFKEAFKYTESKSTKQLIKTIQAIKWNNELKKEILLKKPKNVFSKIFEGKNEEEFPLCASKAMKREIIITPNEFEKQFFKNTLKRKTFFNSKHFSVKKFNKNKYWLNFELGTGEYATIFLKYLEKQIEN